MPPQAARPWVLTGQRHVRQGRFSQAMRAWEELMALQPQTFGLMAMDYAKAAQQAGEVDAACERLRAHLASWPSVAALQALNLLDGTPDTKRQRLTEQLRAEPSLTGAQALLRERLHDHQPLKVDELDALQQAITVGAKPLQRYRCAACGFETQHYFWQCPGCQGWDTYPPRRLEDQ